MSKEFVLREERMASEEKRSSAAMGENGDDFCMTWNYALYGSKQMTASKASWLNMTPLCT